MASVTRAGKLQDLGAELDGEKGKVVAWAYIWLGRWRSSGGYGLNVTG